MISSSRSTLYRFLSLYAALYAGFGVQSPYLPILLDNRHLSPETIALALAAGMAMRLTAAPAVARLASQPGIALDNSCLSSTAVARPITISFCSSNDYPALNCCVANRLAKPITSSNSTVLTPSHCAEKPPFMDGH